MGGASSPEPDSRPCVLEWGLVLSLVLLLLWALLGTVLGLCVGCGCKMGLLDLGEGLETLNGGRWPWGCPAWCGSYGMELASSPLR